MTERGTVEVRLVGGPLDNETHEVELVKKGTTTTMGQTADLYGPKSAIDIPDPDNPDVTHRYIARAGGAYYKFEWTNEPKAAA